MNLGKGNEPEMAISERLRQKKKKKLWGSCEQLKGNLKLIAKQ